MKVEQLYTGCLAEAAYYIESEGEVAIIDPLRDPQPYIDMAKERGATIKYVLETHFHADFVSGHVDLAARTGAKIVFGPNAKAEYEIYQASDGEILPLGKVKIKVLHTPGHTMESTCYLLIDENGKNHSIYTGDTLFIGDVGRPDLAVKSDLTKEDLAGHLYDSLHNKILTLEDEVIVYPGHGAGSACGKNLSSETFATLGNQKQFNYALQPMSKAEFIEKVIDGLTPPPGYFPENVMMNKKGYNSFEEVMEQGTRGLSPAEFEMEVKQGALILDVRDAQTYKDGFLPHSMNIGLDGSFAPWVGALIHSVKRPLALVVDENRLEETVMRLSRVGYDNVVGFLKGGVEAWKAAGKTLQTITSISAEELAKQMASEKIAVLDVRRPSEFLSEHVIGAENFPLDYIHDNIEKLDRNKTYYIHCAGGYRSMVASSILKANGFNNLIDVAGGFKAIKETNVPKTDYVCPSTIKS
jgi:glyoxylase-like metal-dependent hydrolase (beta-lactamase superfamily II)/rhodanese-related sulfurtransferase